MSKVRAGTTHETLLLTHWDPDIYSPRQRPRNLTELILFALIYGKVAIQDGPLILNDYLLKDLQSPNLFDCFSELLRNGFVKILSVDPNDYKGPTEADPSKKPISARAEEQCKYRTFKGKDWLPAPWESEIYCRLDKVVRKSHLRAVKKFPAENVFKRNLEFILANRAQNQLRARPPFRTINDRVADTFITFCQDNDAWKRFLRNHGVPKSKIKEKDFYRSAAYQCAAKFPNSNRSLRNLFQSVYAAHMCDLEKTEGVYTGNLCEIPILYKTEEESSSASEDLVRVEVRPIGKQLSIPLGPDIVEVLAETRRSEAFSNFQERFIKSTTGITVNEGEILRALDDVAVEFAYHSARILTKPTELENKICDVTAWILRGVEVIGYGFGFHGGLAERSQHLVPEGVAKLGPRLSALVRSGYFFTKVRKQVSGSLKVRCTRVKSS
jgi:hypothetical protein